MKETLGFWRRASSDSLVGSIALWLTPVGVLGYYIYQAHGPKEFQEWLVATGLTAVTLVACLLLLFLIALFKSPLTVHRRLVAEATQLRADLNEALKEANAALIAERDRVGARPEEWSVDFHGGVAEIKVLADSLCRYAIALDVVITNRSTRALSLSAKLQAQWAHPMLWNIAQQHEIAIPDWQTILTAFNLSSKLQLLLPMDLAHGVKSGHVVFDIPRDGLGVSSEIGSVMGGIHEEDETERDREYRIVFSDAITGEEKWLVVSTLFAPKLDGLGVMNRTDLAVAGNAETFTVMHRGDATLLSSDLPLRQLPAIAPDVWLEGTFPGAFMLHARGHAYEIRTGPIVMESVTITGQTVTFGDRTVGVKSQRIAIEFPVRSDLQAGAEPITPTVLCGIDPMLRGSQLGESLEAGMAAFFTNAKMLREVEVGRPQTGTAIQRDEATDEAWRVFHSKVNQPITFDFDITFWDSERTQQWVRHEVLVYEPARNAAFVRHAGRPERLVGSSTGSGW